MTEEIKIYEDVEPKEWYSIKDIIHEVTEVLGIPVKTTEQNSVLQWFYRYEFPHEWRYLAHTKIKFRVYRKEIVDEIIRYYKRRSDASNAKKLYKEAQKDLQAFKDKYQKKGVKND